VLRKIIGIPPELNKQKNIKVDDMLIECNANTNTNMERYSSIWLNGHGKNNQSLTNK